MLITPIVEPMPIYKNRPAPSRRSTMDWLWSRISTKIYANSAYNNTHYIMS